MRGVVIREFGPLDTHRLEEVADPAPGADEVLIDIHAIGLNYPDTLMMQGRYQVKPETPFVPGRDAAGTVAAVGANVSHVKTGDRVASVYTFGAYAERRVVPKERCWPLPDKVDFVTGAGMMTTYLTSYVALLVRAQLAAGDTVLVLGATGGVGLAAIEIAKAKGATAIAGSTSMSPEGVALIEAHGADHVIDLSGDNVRDALRDQVYAVTDRRGVDIVLDPIGGDFFDAAIRALAFSGRILAVGFAAGRIPEAKAGYFNVRNLTMMGVALDLHFRHRPDLMADAVAEIMAMCERGEVNPQVTGVHALEDFQSVIPMFQEHGVKGKMVLTTGR